MLENSKDLLYIAIAAAVLLLAGFSSWAIYYFARILQQFFKIVREMRDRLHKLDDLIKTLKEKIEHSTSYLLLIGEGVKKLVEVIEERIDKRDNKDKKEKKKK
jgi:CHASE3 domain sensor protein